MFFRMKKFFSDIVKSYKKARLIHACSRMAEAQRQSKIQITTESRDDLFQDTLRFMAQHKIEFESDAVRDSEDDVNPLDEIENLFRNLSSYETEYRLMPEKLRVYPSTFLAAVLLSQARNALDLLSEVDKENKKIAYYESKKNASLDDLIDLWTKRLDAQNENKLSHSQSRREVEVRRMLARMKKKHPDHINFYLLLYADIRHDEVFQTDLKKDRLDGVINDILDFFEVGHATPDMIYKSVALQIFELFKEIVPLKDLKEIIAELIEKSFDKEYKNFSGFDKKAVYLKNVVGDFGIFDLDDQKNQRYRDRITKVFIKNMMRSNPFLKNSMYQSFFDKMRSNPLYFRLSRLYIKYFGFLPKDFHIYLPR